MFSILTLFSLLFTLAASAVLPRNPPFQLKNMVPSGSQQPPPTCSVSSVQQPVAPTPLPKPTTGNVLSMIAVGRGTQNYTCADSTAASAPTQIGALATLYDASCIARSSPNTLAAVTNAVQKIALSDMPTQLADAGHHYFADVTTPTFAMTELGLTEMKKNASSNAPGAPTDVPWLYLKTKTPDSSVLEVYRLNTAGGAAPTNCQGQAAAFEVQYSAEYWFYTKPSSSS